jgi:hypothetical protein
MRDSVAVAFASREIAALGEFGRSRPEIHVGVDALGMAALAGLRTVIFHVAGARQGEFDSMRGNCTRFMTVRALRSRTPNGRLFP